MVVPANTLLLHQLVGQEMLHSVLGIIMSRA
jgi:hypothetical protein